MSELSTYIRNVPDFPKQGIGFKDITTLLKDGAAFRNAVEAMSRPYFDAKIDKVVGIESRGFIFGAVMAHQWGVGFVPVRKPGKLPAEKFAQSYELEYGTDSIEIHKDAISRGERVLIVDDLLATGGTAAATTALIEKLQGEIVGISFLIELAFLNGRERLSGYAIHSLISYDAE